MIKELRVLIATYLSAWAFEIVPQDSDLKVRLAMLIKEWSGDEDINRRRKASDK